MAVFFLRQTPVESPAEEEALEWGCLQGAESPRAGRAPLRPPAVVEAEVRPVPLRAVEKPQPLLSGSLKHRQVPSKNTIAEVADKLTVWVALPFVSPLQPYLDQLRGPGTPLSDSLLISKEIL